jgi:hypothetical protein
MVEKQRVKKKRGEVTGEGFQEVIVGVVPVSGGDEEIANEDLGITVKSGM